MASKIQGEAIADEPGKAWSPSRRPAHRLDGPDNDARIVEQQVELGLLGKIGQFLKLPFVRLVIGLGIFISAAIVYDHTVNFGEWTERKEKAKAAKHRGADPIQETPDG